jgi:two-component system response regulator FlrC
MELPRRAKMMLRSENKIETRELGSVDHDFSELLQLSRTIAKSRATVLIQGATGTGKKTIAKYIHENSVRSERNFEVLNVKEFAGENLEAEFKKKLELSLGGTFLIVEISKLTLSLQQKVYEAVQSGTDIRWIATSSEDLSRLVAEGSFREDLFYRFNVVNLKVPSLVNRLSDLELLSNSFAHKYSKVHGRTTPSFAEDAIQYLKSQKWPGNLRELESAVERAVLLSTGTEIRPRDIQITVSKEAPELLVGTLNAPDWKPGKTLDEIERNVILEALKYHEGNRTHTAKALGISIRTLRNKLAEYRVLGINA